MKKILALFSLLLALVQGDGQTTKTITLEECHKLAREQYPLLKQHGLIDKTKDYSIQNAAKGYYPQLTFNAQATYQSDVTKLPFNIDVPQLDLKIVSPEFSKDQYKIYGQIDQLIYDGGIIRNNKQLFDANSKIQQQNLEVQLYALKDRINQLFFGVLLIDEQLKQNELMQKDIQNNIDKVQEGVNYGTATRSSLAELQAVIIQQEQNNIQLHATRKAYSDVLGVFTNNQFDENTKPEIPVPIRLSDSIVRPEIFSFNEQMNSFEIQDKLLSSSNRPRLSFFFQGGYGRPGLNAFDNKFDSYYIGGFRFNWSLGGLYTLSNQRNLLKINRQSTDVQKETFLFNTKLQLKQQNAEIEKLQSLIKKDNDIIARRTEVKLAANSQMENGVITIHEYLSQLDAEDLAKQNLLLHQVQLLLAEYSYQNTTGN